MILAVNGDAYQFKTLSEFKSSISRGGDVEFKWKGIDYTISSIWPDGKMEFSAGPCTHLEKDFTVYDTVNSWNIRPAATGCVILLRRQKSLTGHCNEK